MKKLMVWLIGFLIGCVIAIAPSVIAYGKVVYLPISNNNFLLTQTNPQTKTFENPSIGGQRLDYCYTWERNCGKPTAQEFCKLNGYNKLVRYAVDYRPQITQVISDGKICQEGVNHRNCDSFKFITCSNRITSSNTKNPVPLFKGALDLAANNSLTIYVPIGNGRREEVSVRMNEAGQLIDPLTNKIATSIKYSKTRNNIGSRITDDIFRYIKNKVRQQIGSTPREQLNFAIKAIDIFPDVMQGSIVKIIESRIQNGMPINPMSIAYGFITGDFPSYLNDLDGFGVLPLFDKINKELSDVNNYINNRLKK